MAAVDAGVDDRDGRAVAAADVPRGGQVRARDPPLQRRAGAASRARSRASSARGRWARRRSSWRRSASTWSTPRGRAAAAAHGSEPRPPVGRTETRPSCGTCAPSRRTPSSVDAPRERGRGARAALRLERDEQAAGQLGRLASARRARAAAPARAAARGRADSAMRRAAARRRPRRGLRSPARTSRPRSSSPATTAGRRPSSS